MVEVIDNDVLSTIEEIAIKWQYTRFGSFYTSLMKTISLADQENLERLRYAFPYHVKSFDCFSKQEGWWQAVQEKAKKLNMIIGE